MVVVDSQNHRVQRFTPEGDYLGGFGSHGSEPGQFELPWGVHIDELGDIYVADWGNDSIQRFSPTGDFIATYCQSGKEERQLQRK